MEKCIFCEIIKKSIPSFVVHEDNFSIAFLDIKPRSKGMTLVVSRKHYKDFEEDLDSSINCFKTSLIVASKIKKALNPKFIIFSILPSEVEHFHIRLYPVYEQIPILEGAPLSISENELKEIAEKIKSVKLVEERKEKVKEKGRSKEEIEWIRRYILKA